MVEIVKKEGLEIWKHQNTSTKEMKKFVLLH